MPVENELELLKEYMSVYIQFIAHNIHKRYIPSFEDFKSDYLSFINPFYIDAIYVSEGNLRKHHVVGSGVINYSNNVAVRKFNFMAFGYKIFAPNNINGDYTIINSNMNSALKLIK